MYKRRGHNEPSPAQSAVESRLGAALPGYAEPTYVCPFCRIRGVKQLGHLHINYDKEKALCHKCGYATSNIRSLVKQIGGKVSGKLFASIEERGFLKTIKEFLADKEAVKEKPKKLRLPPGYIPLTFPPKKMMAEVCVDYLLSRGIDEATMQQLGMGYAFKGRFAGMIIFPIFVNDKLVFYTSRRVLPGAGPKCIHAEVPRSFIMYNMEALVTHRRVFINEGVFDALSWPVRLGVGVATFGHKLHDDQARFLCSFKNIREFVVSYDADAYDSSLEAAALLYSLDSQERKITVVKFEEGDPNSERKRLGTYFKTRQKFDIALQASSILQRSSHV